MRGIAHRIGRGLFALVGLALFAPDSTIGAESYDAIYMGQIKVGHMHVVVTPLPGVKDARGRAVQRVQVNTVMSTKRGRDRSSLEMRYGTIETLDGSVDSLDIRTQTGNDTLRTSGEATNGSMRLILELGRQRQEQTIPWPDDVKGPYAAELSLTRQPMKPGESRELKMFVPVLNSVCQTQLKAVEKERVTLGGGVTRELMRIEQTGTSADGKTLPELETTLWVDDGGQVLKTHIDTLGGIDSYRTTRAGAFAPNGDFDLLAATILKVSKPFADPVKTRSVVYQVTLTAGELRDLFPDDHRQTLTLESPLSGKLVVKSDSPNQGDPAASPPGEEYLRPNPLINSDDPRIIQHMRTAVGGLTDPWQKAVAIEKWVWNNLRSKNFGTVFASAKEVAQTLEGDCTEHGVLTAAMCRAAGVPSRVVVGLVYAAPQNGFGGHMWNEVFVNNRWVAIDSTFNESQVDATHIKMSVSSLEGVAPFEAMTPIMRLFQGTLKIEPLEVH